MSEVSGKRVIITVVLPKMLLQLLLLSPQDFTTKGYLLIHQNLDEINALQNALLQRVYIALIIIYLLSFMIFLAFELLVHRPLVEITQAATQYASGNLNYEIPIRTSDEMGYLSASLQLYVFTASGYGELSEEVRGQCLPRFPFPSDLDQGAIMEAMAGWHDSSGNARANT